MLENGRFQRDIIVTRVILASGIDSIRDIFH